MNAELAVREDTTLAIAPDQSSFTETQTKALEHIGVSNASDGDLGVFFHVCKRSGLDPFARQIYMIGRQESAYVDGQWVKVVKQTIQTGIDGFRLIGRRAADHAGHTVSVGAPEWMGDDGNWRPVWSQAWGVPLAARVTIRRAGEPFTAIALFDEYAQRKQNGDLTRMWAQRPAGQLAKCAEALAWRMACPQDLSGIYTDDEMGQADGAATITHTQPQGTGGGGLGKVLNPETSSPAAEDTPLPVRGDGPDGDINADGSGDTAAGEEPDDAVLDMRSKLAKRMFAVLGDAGLTDRDERLAEVSAIVGRTIDTSTKMTVGECRQVINTLEIRSGNTEEPVDAELVEDGSGT